MSNSTSDKVFDYRALRLIVGIIAFALPFAVSLFSSHSLSSISASYHSEARDLFVGMMCIVSAFLWAYRGHTSRQALASKVASIAALLVAFFPTCCDTCPPDWKSFIHYGAAILLFSMLMYFCFGPFREKTKRQKGKKGRRGKMYFGCGCVMAVSMAGLIIGKLLLSDVIMTGWSITYWAEAVALCAFGCAWMTAGKTFKPLVDEEDALHLFK